MTSKGSSIPFIPEVRIERAANDVLARWSVEREWVPAPRVPVDEIIELQLGLRVDSEDLRGKLGLPDVLGAIFFRSKSIQIDDSLDIEAHPHLLGRYRWTLAHEGGHWVLHRELLTPPAAEASLFGELGAPEFVCRSSHKPPEEKQADLFARYLLMPTEMVRRAWTSWRGDSDPVFLTDLREDASASDTDAAVIDRFIRPFAEVFEVSREAMRYRVQDLGLVLPSRDGLLFA